MEAVTAEDGSTRYMTIRVTPEQEAAMEAFFQINNWALIKEGDTSSEYELEDDEEYSRLMTIRVTGEQEAAMEAFFQINNWLLVMEGDTAEKGEGEGEGEEGERQQTEIQVQQVEDIAEQVADQEMTVEEVSTSESTDIPQIITVYTNNGQASEIPQIIVQNGTGMDQQNLPHIIVQEITLPKGDKDMVPRIITSQKPLTIAEIGDRKPKTVTPRGTVKPGDKVHKCPICNKVFKQSPSFNGHYQSHLGEKPFQCSICHTGFTLKAALVAHMSIHSGAKPFACQICNKGFRRKDDMLSHMRTHTGEKPYECDICGKKFKYRNQIPKHKRAHTGERPYVCGVCDKAFSSNIHLRRHERVHTGERPFKCTVCLKAFTQYGHLQAHIRIHTDERPFVCSICGRGFREKKVLKKHESIHSMDKPFKCSVCGKGFLRQSNMELHSVMHAKDNGSGVKRGPPRPKKKKKSIPSGDDEMRDFVESVLSSVVKVETGIQTDMGLYEVEVASSNQRPQVVEEETVKSELHSEALAASDTLAAFVQFAVESHENEARKGSGTLIANDPQGYVQTVAGIEQQVPTVAAELMAESLQSGNVLHIQGTEEMHPDNVLQIETSEVQTVTEDSHQYSIVLQNEVGSSFNQSDHVLVSVGTNEQSSNEIVLEPSQPDTINSLPDGTDSTATVTTLTNMEFVSESEGNMVGLHQQNNSVTAAVTDSSAGLTVKQVDMNAAPSEDQSMIAPSQNTVVPSSGDDSGLTSRAEASQVVPGDDNQIDLNTSESSEIELGNS